ncbi:MAG: small ribosomal subunit Rsm22 family protein [Kofleriaceae bacterium]
MRYLPALAPRRFTLDDLEDALYTAARAVVGDAQLSTSALVEAIRDRSARYTSDRAKLAKPALPKADLAARAVFFTITDAPKIAIPIAELASRAALPAARPLRVVDLGAGCGAMSLGLITALTKVTSNDALAKGNDTLAIEITAIDRDRDALAIATKAIGALTSPTSTNAIAVELTTRVDDATTAAIPTCDLVLIGTMLNELATDAARLALVERALAAITDDGAVIILEPALRDTTRGLHVLRDAILARGSAHVFAPCTRQSAPCPALADPTDWCHEHHALGRAPTLPPKTHELARLTHLRDDGLKLSYLVLRKQARTLSADPGAWRIVGTPWQQKGKLEVLACGNAGRVTLRLLKRHRAASNRSLERATKGYVVRVDAIAATAADVERGVHATEARIEITDDTRVELVFPREDDP